MLCRRAVVLGTLEDSGVDYCFRLDAQSIEACC